MKLKMKRKFDPKLTDKESPEFKELETKILDKFRAGFEKIAQEKGMEVDLSVTFVEEGAARKRRNTEGGNTQGRGCNLSRNNYEILRCYLS